jgi:DNA-binding NtrC family response regulator
MTKTTGNILIVDDDPYIVLSLQTLLEQYYTGIVTLDEPSKIPDLLKSKFFEVILLDMNFKPGDTSGREGIKWIKKIGEIEPLSNVIVITAFGGINTAVKAMKAGAMDFVVKPWQNEKILTTVSSAYRLCQSRMRVSQLQSTQKILSSTLDHQFSEMIGKSESIKKVFDELRKVATTDASVLVLGENGTGKELVARAIHRMSSRSDEVFISVDLGSITETIFESELFGHVKGAFTDAKEDRIGRFEAASGGTLFLDEIGNLSLPLQTKLLTVLEKREITRVGSNRPIPIDIRLICATNRPLKEMAEEGRFRQDLLYRINTVELLIPPLRDRSDDIPLLAEYFLEKFTKKYHKENLKLPERVIKKLQSFEWPGNIREFQHALERAVILSDGVTLTPGDFQINEDLKSDIKEEETFNLEKLEKKAIEGCLEKQKGNITKAAEELGLTRGALYRRIEKYGI